MLSQSLFDFYPWDTTVAPTSITAATASSVKPESQRILVVDADSGSGEFAFNSLLIKYIKQGEKVMLVSTNHSRRHYEYILRKYVRL
jgi:hypothetical protein